MKPKQTQKCLFIQTIQCMTKVSFPYSYNEGIQGKRGIAPLNLLLLIKRYNLYKVLVCSTAFFQLSLFCAIFFQLCTFIFLISSQMSFSQRVLGLPIGLLDMGFHFLIFLLRYCRYKNYMKELYKIHCIYSALQQLIQCS